MGKFGKKARLSTMLVMTFLFFLAEIVTGYMTNSMALVADSFHMLSDVLSIVIGLLAVIYAGKENERNTYGGTRAEILGAMANAVFLMALVFTIVIGAIQRLVIVEDITQPLLVLGVGIAGLVINVIGLVLFGSHGHDHGHSHGEGGHDNSHSHESHDHDDNKLTNQLAIVDSTQPIQNIHTEDATIQDKHSKAVGAGAPKKKKKSSAHMNMQAVFLHVLGDALGSVVVIVSALIIHFVEDDWKLYIDPAMSLIISIIISCTTIPLLRRASMILLQNPPNSMNVKEVGDEVSKVEGVISVHDLHVWQLTGNCVIATVHIILDDDCNFTEVARRIKHIFHEVNIHATTIQPEYLSKKKLSQSALEGVAGQADLTFCQCYENKDQRSRCELHFTEVMCDGGDLNVLRSPSCANTEGAEVFSPFAGGDPDSSATCLMSCISDDCQPYMCCDELRQRNKNQKPNNCFANPGYGDAPAQELVDDEKEVSVRI